MVYVSGIPLPTYADDVYANDIYRQPVLMIVISIDYVYR